MTSALLLSTVYVAASFVVVCCAFCRLKHTTIRTWTPVRAAFFTLFCVFGWGLFSVLVGTHCPNFNETLAAVGIAFVQFVSSKLWDRGVPTKYMSSRLEEPT